jgi:hypothetical protein
MTVVVRSTWQLEGWNGDELRRRVPFIMTGFAAKLDLQLKEEIKLVQFPWTNRKTYRRNGTIEGTPRDIVDTGAFLRSQNRRRDSPTQVTFTWGGVGGVTYAGIILRGKGPSYPARDWISPALAKVPLDRYFSDEWSRLASQNL